MKKLNKKDKNYIFSIVVLTILLILSLFFNFLGGFGIEYSINCLYEVGDDFVLNLRGIGAQSKSFALSGSSLPNDKVKQKFVIVLPDMDTNNVVLRAKVDLVDTQVQIYGFETWSKSEYDDYYYYTGQIYPNQSIGLCNEVSWGNIELNNNIVYYMEFVIEYFYDSNLNP